MKTPKKVLSALKEGRKFLIAAHINPDGDALGSALALSSALSSLGKKTYVYSRDPVPRQYEFLPRHEKVISDLKNVRPAETMLVLVDCNCPERAALEEYRFKSSLVIDHHETEKDFGDVRWVDSGAAATGLMVYALIKALGIGINKEIATDLYTAIAVDTGTFRYGNTSSEVLMAGAALVKAGAEPGRIADALYETWDYRRFKLLVMTLHTLEMKSGIAMAYVTKDMFRKTGTGEDDTENFSNFPRMIDSVKISIFLRELGKDTWKVSLRSKGDVNVAKIAEQFGGGGHRNAAGCKIKADLESARRLLFRAGRK